MSSTTSSDRLTLLSYATFNHHIHIHDHSDSTWRQHQWKHRDNDSFSTLQSAKKLFQKDNLWNLTTVSWA